MTATATRTAATGLVIALASAAAFGTSGAFVKPLLDAGWSPVAAVTVRAAGGGLVLLVPALVALRGRWRMLWQAWRQVLAYALIAVVGCQVFYFAALETLDVGTALLIEYSAPVLLVLFAWARTRMRPQTLTILGAIVSILGLALVVGPGGSQGFDLLGVGFASLAALCLAGYYLIVAAPSGDLPPVTLVSAGLLVAALALGGLGATGLVPFTVSSVDPVVLGTSVPWWVPMGVVVLVATAFAYLTGLLAAQRLGSRVASFVGLAEVLFAILLAWLLLGQVPTLLQAAGGALIVVGVVLVRLERSPAPIADAVPDPLPLTASIPVVPPAAATPAITSPAAPSGASSTASVSRPRASSAGEAGGGVQEGVS
jgi:drug/metabolite transporter (DMT)-like permease